MAMLATPLFSSNLGAAVAQVAARVRASVTEIWSRGGSGSGTIWSADGAIVTNHHVLPGQRAHVTLEDGREYEGRTFARDPRNDLAVLRVDGHDLPEVTLGDARTLRSGELVLAVGNPAGVRSAVTIGVLHRPLPRSHAARGRELIQADVLLGPGSSGGPLTDSRGRVIGINAMVHGGMALAVPTHVVARLLGRGARTPVLGIAAQEVALPPALAAATTENAMTGSDAQSAPDAGQPESAMLVMRVEAGSVADLAGLLLGDLLYAANGNILEGDAGLLNALDGHFAGPLTLSVLRGGVPRDVEVSWDVAGEATEKTREQSLLRAA